MESLGINRESVNNSMKEAPEKLVEEIKKRAGISFEVSLWIGLLLVGGLWFSGDGDFALFIGLLLYDLLSFNRSMVIKMKSIEKKDNTFRYLSDFRNLTTYINRLYVKRLGFGLFICAVPLFLFSIEVAGISMAEAFSAENINFTVGLMLIVMVLFPATGIGFYLLSTKALYWKKMKKLDDLIAGMSEVEEEHLLAY